MSTITSLDASFAYRIVDALPMQIAVLDSTGGIVFVNAAWQKFAIDHEASALVMAGVGLNYLEVCRNVQGADSTIAQQVCRGIESVLAGKEERFSLEYPCYYASNEIWYRLETSPLAGAQGGAVVAHFEANERRQTINALQQSEARNRALAEFLPGLVVHGRGDGTILDVKVPAGFPPLFLPPAELIGKRPADILPAPLAQELMEYHKKALQTGEVQSFEYELVSLEQKRTQEANIIPVPGDEVITLVRDISERRRSEQEIQAREKFIQLVLDKSPTPIFVKDGLGNFLLVNQALADVYGVSKAQLIRNPLVTVHSPMEELSYYAAVDRRVIEEQITIAGEEKFTKPNGEVGWYYVVKAPLVQEDGTTQVLGISIDITQRRQTEEALRQSEARNRALLEAIPDVVVRTRRDGLVMDIKMPPDFASLYSGGTSIGKKQDEILPPYLVGLSAHYRQLALETGTVQIYEYAITIADKLYNREARVVPTGEEEVIVFVRDITERKQTEEALRQSEAQNRALLEAIPDMITRVRRDGTILDIKQATNHPISQLALGAKNKKLAEVAPAPIAGQGMHYIQLALETKVPQTFEHEVTVAGKLYCRESRIVPVGGDEVIVISRDITERKQMEAALRQGEAHTRALLEAIPDLIARVRSDGTHLEVKESKDFTVIRPIAEMIGKKQADVLPTEVARQFAHYQNLALTTGKLQTFEYTMQIDSETYNREARIVPVGPDEVIAILRDVSEIVRQRAKLRAMSQRLAELQEAERKELARELHDQVGQNLTALGLNLKLIQAQLPVEVSSAHSVQKRFDDSASLLEQTTAAIRNVMAELRPPVLDDYGLLATLRWYGQQVATRSGFAVEAGGEEVLPRLPETTENALFRIVQESLTNISKHAHANHANIWLQPTPERVILTISDDGTGFDLEALRKPDLEHGWGLLNMQERAAAVGGICRIESHLGRGTTITVEVTR